jgi:hypothetical protein
MPCLFDPVYHQATDGSALPHPLNGPKHQKHVADGATRFVGAGPGKVLQGLIKKIEPLSQLNVPCWLIFTFFP